MRLDFAVLAASLLSSAAALAIDGPRHPDETITSGSQQGQNDLFKRRGGGGSGGRGGGSSSSSGGGGSRGGTGGGASSSPARGNTVPSSNRGGTSRGGTGPSRSFGGNRFYPGGGATPYRSGARSVAGIAPFLLIGAALAFWPGVWLYGAHMYPYSYVHRFHNATTDKNETANVICGCAEFAVCGCDENNSTAFYDQLIGNGSYAALNTSVVNVGQFRGSKTLLINGTLPNGTTADGPDEESAAGKSLVMTSGFWPLACVILATVSLA